MGMRHHTTGVIGASEFVRKKSVSEYEKRLVIEIL